MSKQYIIIGGGLGGLFLGKLMARARMEVTILEQGLQPGGALQTFVREGIRFDTGFHSVGGMEPGGRRVNGCTVLRLSRKSAFRSAQLPDR